VKPTSKECYFSIELDSKKHLKNVNLANGTTRKKVTVEGTIGQFNHAKFIDTKVLEVVGKKGIFRIDLSPEQIKNYGER
jgi:hypothetical protein